MTLRTVALCLLAAAAFAEEPAGFPASDLRWRGLFGGRESDPKTLYCLMGCGYRRATLSEDLPAVVKAWNEAHPSARAVPVWSFEVVDKDSPHTVQTWVWLVDGDANLAIEMISKGCCPAGTMGIPLGENPEAPDAQPLVAKRDYEAFLDGARKAEDAARKARAGIWSNPALLEQECLALADRLRTEAKYAEAAAAYQDAIKAGADPEACWMAIAECREAMGEYPAALAAYDEAIATGGIGALGARAHCMSRYEGAGVGAAWLQALIDKQTAGGDRAFLWSVLGLFHMEEDRLREALGPLRKAVQIRCDEGAFKFDDHDALVIDEPTAHKQADDYLPAAVTIEPLAMCALKAGELDEAFHLATRGISLLQQFRRCEGKYAADEVEAGDAACRSIRAIVLARQERFDEAWREAALARLLAVRGKAVTDRESADLAELVIRQLELEKRQRDEKKAKDGK